MSGGFGKKKGGECPAAATHLDDPDLHQRLGLLLGDARYRDRYVVVLDRARGPDRLAHALPARQTPVPGRLDQGARPMVHWAHGVRHAAHLRRRNGGGWSGPDAPSFSSPSEPK